MSEVLEAFGAIAGMGMLFLLVYAGLGIEPNGPDEPDTQEMHDLVG